MGSAASEQKGWCGLRGSSSCPQGLLLLMMPLSQGHPGAREPGGHPRKSPIRTPKPRPSTSKDRPNPGQKRPLLKVWLLVHLFSTVRQAGVRA